MVLPGIKPRIFSRLNDSKPRDQLYPYMLYRSEAILPTDLDYGSQRALAFNEKGNELALEDAIDQIYEACHMALLHSAKHQHSLRWYHDRNVEAHCFNVGDLVLRQVLSSKDKHKLSPPWEGPFVVSRIIWPRSFKLKTLEDQESTNEWNIAQLRKFYP